MSTKKLFTSALIGLGLLYSTPTLAHEQQIDCLARNAYHEARGEGIAGIRAVTHVVMNRTKNSKFPNNPCSVIYQRSQFSWTRAPQPIRNKSVYELCKELAKQIYYGRDRDLTRGSLFFHSTAVSGWPKLTRTIRIGNHIFYRF